MDRDLISVIIPSYNRAHLLSYTLPTYIQPKVGEIIIINDASTDNTEQVIKTLTKKYNIIKYVKLKHNRKQPYAKNVGIKLAKYKYIYFGDDDSFLLPNTLEELIKTMNDYKCDIVGARALYMNNNIELRHLNNYLEKCNSQHSAKKRLVNFNNLEFNFNLYFDYPQKSDMVHACFLIKSKLAKKILFDTNYIGNAYREETDFLMRAHKLNALMYYNSKATQINLPRNVAKGGAHSKGEFIWCLQTIRNNNYFLNKHYKYMKTKFKISENLPSMKLKFATKILNNHLFPDNSI